MKLYQAIEELEEFNRGQLRSEKTIRFYNQRLAVFEEYVSANADLEQIDRDDVRTFMSEIRDQYSPETVRATTVAVKRLFSWSEKEGLIAENPIADLDLPRVPKEDRQALSKEELQQILKHGFRNSRAGERWRTMVLLDVDTGLRVSELCSLRLEDIERDGEIRVRQGKGAADRVVFAGQRAIQRTTTYINNHRPRPQRDFDEYLWINNNGRRVQPSAFRKALYFAGDRVGVSIHPHKLRRTFATMMLRNKADLFTLQELMGHSDIATTRRYIPRDLDRLREVHRSASPGDML